MLLTNRFSWFGAGALGVERQRTGLKLGSGSEPALELPWWKRGIKELQSSATRALLGNQPTPGRTASDITQRRHQ